MSLCFRGGDGVTERGSCACAAPFWLRCGRHRPCGSALVCWRKFADFNVAEGDGKAVILKQDVSVVRFAEVRPNVIFAVGNELAELRGEALVLDDLDAVEPVLAVGSANDDACG